MKLVILWSLLFACVVSVLVYSFSTSQTADTHVCFPTPDEMDINCSDVKYQSVTTGLLGCYNKTKEWTFRLLCSSAPLLQKIEYECRYATDVFARCEKISLINNVSNATLVRIPHFTCIGVESECFQYRNFTLEESLFASIAIACVVIGILLVVTSQDDMFDSKQE
jgi:hypothetical protein